MKKLTGESMNITEENLKAMQQLFPEAFEEGKIDFDVLRQLLGDFVDDEQERYSFKWNGKGKALRLSQTPSMGTLRPCKEESKDWDNTENLYIEGDNLEVLKLLQKSYYGKVKMIYIDKRIAYLIQSNENENSLKALDIRGFREFLILDASPVNDRFRGNRPRFSYEILPTGANKKTAV